MIRFRMAHDQYIDRSGIDLILQQRNPAVSKFGVTAIDQSGAFTTKQKGVVSGAVALAEHDI